MQFDVWRSRRAYSSVTIHISTLLKGGALNSQPRHDYNTIPLSRCLIFTFVTRSALMQTRYCIAQLDPEYFSV